MGAGVLEHNLLNALIFKNLWLYFDKKYIELLIKSKYSFMQIKSNGGFISALDGVKAEKLPSIVKELCELEKIYQKHEKELSSLEYKELSFKNKIRLAVYNKIYKTLHKKGIV